MKLTWDNLLVGADEFSPKHPQLTIRPRRDDPGIKDQTRTQDLDETMITASFDPAGQV
jgi:hypothetical protein